MLPIKYLTLAASVLLAASISSAETLYDFNTPAQTENFDFTGGSSNPWTYGASGGIDNSGWLAAEGATGGFIVSKQGTSESSFTLSVNFQWQNPTNTGATQFLGLGIVPFASSASPNLNTPSTQAVASLSWGSQGLRLALSSSTNTTPGSVSWNNSSFIDAPLTDGGWYLFSTEILRDADANKITLSANLYAADPITGAATGAVLLTTSRTYTNATLSDDDVNVFFGTSTNVGARGIAGVDNFLNPVPMIPESGATVLIASGIAFLGVISVRFFRTKRQR